MLPLKWENLSRCSTKVIHFWKNHCLLHWIEGRTNIFRKYIIYIFFQFWAWLLRFLFYVFSKSSSYCGKETFWNNFWRIVLLICMSSKSISQIFKILFQTGHIDIFVLRDVLCSRYVQLKSCFSDEKNISGEIWDML